MASQEAHSDVFGIRVIITLSGCVMRPKIDKERIEELLEQGLTHKVIATRLGISLTPIREIVAKKGLQRRKKGVK